MKLSLDYGTARYTINAYETGVITINQQPYVQSLVVSPDNLLENWSPTQVEHLDALHIEYLISLKPEIILLGTGSTIKFPHPSLTAPALQQGIGFEVMDTGSACRTYNVLSAEDRNVVAALLIIN